MKSGIYAIINKCNNKIYIGQSKSIKQRIARHKSELKHNHHKNIYLQREYNKYGYECFDFVLLELCAESEMTDKEKYYIKKYQSNDYNNGFNLTDGGENTEWTELAREKMRGRNNHMYGKKPSGTTLKAMRMSSLGSSDKLTHEDVKDIKIKLLQNVGIKDISKKYGVTTSTIHKIYSLKNWDWVAEELNEKLTNKRKGSHDLIAERNKKILHDIENGLTTKFLMEKYNVSRHVIGNVKNPR